MFLQTQKLKKYEQKTEKSKKSQTSDSNSPFRGRYIQQKIMSDQKLQKYMTDLDTFLRRPSLTDEDRVILATAMLYTTRIVYEENYGPEIAINLIDTLGGSKVQYQKPTVH